MLAKHLDRHKIPDLVRSRHQALNHDRTKVQSELSSALKFLLVIPLLKENVYKIEKGDLESKEMG